MSSVSRSGHTDASGSPAALGALLRVGSCCGPSLRAPWLQAGAVCRGPLKLRETPGEEGSAQPPLRSLWGWRAGVGQAGAPSEGKVTNSGCSLHPLTTCLALQATSHGVGSHREQRNWLPLPSDLQCQTHLCPPSVPHRKPGLSSFLLPQTLVLARLQVAAPHPSLSGKELPFVNRATTRACAEPSGEPSGQHRGCPCGTSSFFAL